MRNFSQLRLVLVALAGAALFAALLLTTGGVQISTPRTLLTDQARTPAPTPRPTSTPTPTPSGDAAAAQPSQNSATPTPAALFPALPEITPPPDGAVHTLAPAPEAVGWAQQDDALVNHLGDYYIYSGIFDGRAQMGLVQFDLSSVPPGAPVLYADLVLVGLSDQWRGQDGTWTVGLLEAWAGEEWSSRSYADLSSTDALSLELEETLAASNLQVGQANVLEFNRAARAALEKQVLAGRASFRIMGPTEGTDNLFAWDSGHGSRSRGWAPALRLITGPAPEHPPATPTPFYVIITSTPAPANVVTAAALAGTATAQATRAGTPTPLPPLWVTPVVLVPTPTPANAATAQWHAAVGTAQASLYGTPTPLPPNVWTVTPTPTPWMLVITHTPTPANWSTALARAEADATRWAIDGTPTHLPANVVTATPPSVVVTRTPRPENHATAQALSARATIVALTTGTFTPVPKTWVMATPTRRPTWTPKPTAMPLLIPFDRMTATPGPTPVPWTAPQSYPAALRGRIAFMSDRLGTPRVFVMDPDGRNVDWLTQPSLYDQAQAQLAVSGSRAIDVRPDNQGVLQLYLVDPNFDLVRPITSFTGQAFQGAWAPDGETIALVSTESGNDEIWTISVDGRGQRRLTWNTWEWDKHPSWSPDGEQIVFYSNRYGGRTQIWIMDADGSHQRNLSNNTYNDWDPVWIK